jgi:excinuclease ABC subunit C
MTFDISKINIPSNPGIYMMKGSGDKIIYIGKAKNLKNRVRSYFLKNQNYKTQKLVENISDIEFVLTDNESEAFLLESNMIKKHRPRFNIELKDQQRYTYLRISDEKYPRLLVARRTRDGNFLGKGKFFGPFTQGSSKLLTIGTLRKSFQIRICKQLPKKVCLEYHLGNCEGPCEFKDAQNRYQNHVSALEEVLKGKNQTQIFTKKLEEDMRQAASLQQFERAKDIRDTLIRLGSLQTKQKMEYVEHSDEEYFGIGYKDQTAHVMTFRLINGIIRDSDRFFFDLVADNSFSNFLFQYYSTHKLPKFIIVNELPENNILLESLFSEQACFPIKIVCPQDGKKRDILDLILKNISLVHLKDGDPGLVELRDVLHLSAIPNIIECFDISNHGEEFAVGSMSRFVGGKPHKSGYRRFKIKTVSGRNDFAMISEVIKRRYLRLLEENSQMPDLVLIDGGKGQLNAALQSLQSLGLKTPCVSIAKENEEIFVANQKHPVIISKDKPSLKILQHARDETHRFGVAYNRAIRKNQIK